MTEHKFFNTGDAELDSCLNEAIKTFEKNLKSTYNATVEDKDKFRKFFLSSFDTFLDAANEVDRNCGCNIDEVYGDEVFDSMTIPEEDEEDED